MATTIKETSRLELEGQSIVCTYRDIDGDLCIITALGTEYIVTTIFDEELDDYREIFGKVEEEEEEECSNVYRIRIYDDEEDEEYVFDLPNYNPFAK